ncbi:MAG: DUF222 domain-containing protein [Algicola sp.]|nr:DUF222 domain-containing protein [Algicola sp.]
MHWNIMDGINDEFKHDSDGELADKLTLLAGQINAATYRFLKLLAEFDSRKGWCKHGIRSCSAWLNLKCCMASATAREKLRVAHCLENLPETNLAFENGVLSYSKVRAITRVATDDNEKIFLDIAMSGTANHMDELVRRYQKVDESQQPVEQGDEYQKRQLNYFQDREGMWIIRAKLPQVEGGLLIKALEEISRQQNKNDSAEATAQEQNDSAEAALVEQASYSQKRADAIAALAEHFIATATVDDENGGIKALAGHERCQVVLHVQAETLQAEHEHGDGCNCHYDAPFLAQSHIDQQWITPANAKRFSCDASILTAVEDKYGNVLNLGRKTRTVSPTLKRALDIRDTSCRFPGCCANKYVDFHHIQHWCNGGETEPDNLIKLCRFHHDQLHQSYYTIHLQQQSDKNYGHKWLFIAATGEVIAPNSVLPMPKTKDFMDTQWPNINSNTGVSRWQGKPLDYPRALIDLLWCKRHKARYHGNK